LVQGKKKSLSPTKNHENKQFSQSIRLPDGIDKYNVTSQILDDGMLVVDVPLSNSVMDR
jgi:HSP20 family molecular chaperone IbpA